MNDPSKYVDEEHHCVSVADAEAATKLLRQEGGAAPAAMLVEGVRMLCGHGAAVMVVEHLEL